MTAPTLDEIDRIARLGDPILRNLQITQCYYEISHSVAGLIGHSANWCTFATWASKQAGQTIRQEDLIRAFEECFYLSDEISAALADLASNLRRIGALNVELPRKAMFRAINPAAAFARASDAVARGNKKVFEEIGRQFARFLEFFAEQTRFELEEAARFCAGLRAGEPARGTETAEPGVQELLRGSLSDWARESGVDVAGQPLGWISRTDSASTRNCRATQCSGR